MYIYIRNTIALQVGSLTVLIKHSTKYKALVVP